MRGRAAGALLCIAATFVAACSSGPPAPRIHVDGSPRYPDDEGTVTKFDENTLRITIDGKRSYVISEKARVFATSTLQPVGMRGRVGQYVQVGVSKKYVVWVATFTQVVQLANTPPLAFEVGNLVRVDSRHRAVFRDGTVLRLADGVALPTLPAHVRADIDVGSHSIRELVQLSD